MSTRDLGANASVSYLHAGTVEQQIGDLSQDYGNDGFLQRMRRFTSLRGYPAKIYSDSGAQLVAANKELKGMYEKLDEQQLKEFGVEKGLSWHFVSPQCTLGKWLRGIFDKVN